MIQNDRKTDYTFDTQSPITIVASPHTELTRTKTCATIRINTHYHTHHCQSRHVPLPLWLKHHRTMGSLDLEQILLKAPDLATCAV